MVVPKCCRRAGFSGGAEVTGEIRCPGAPFPREHRGTRHPLLRRSKLAQAGWRRSRNCRSRDHGQTAQREGKDTGTVRLQDGPVTVVAELPKRVDWDQTMLANLVERIRADGADPAEYVDIAFSVPERKYTAWPKDIRQEFEPARTVRTGKPKFRLLLGEEAR
jgi:hypothetical protein